MADVTQEERERAAQRELPDRDAAREWLESMMLIRRFEERAGEMYAKAKVGGFLHLAIGEEATIVGAVRAMRDEDYLISTYRSHGHAIVRGTNPDNVMAELFGRVHGVSRGRGGSPRASPRRSPSRPCRHSAVRGRRSPRRACAGRSPRSGARAPCPCRTGCW